MGNKVLVVGIDSLDPALLERFAGVLPNFTKLRSQTPQIHAQSIFPVDSIPAWTSIFTGQNPARHGLIYSFDVFETVWKSLVKIDNSIFKDKTFFDHASKSGKRVCILFPMMCFPPWEVNGVMVARRLQERKIPGKPQWMVEREAMAYPAEVMSQYQIPSYLKGIAGRHPGYKRLGEFARMAQEMTSYEAQLALKISQDVSWDLGFVFFSWLDILEHFFWRYFDETDPTFPGPNMYENVIQDAYRSYDEILGQLMAAHPKAIVAVVSDHGHGMRPPKTVNLNEVLRKNGLLFPKAKGVSSPIPVMMEGAKRAVLNVMHKFELDYWIINIAKSRFFSGLSKDLYMSMSSIDIERSTAYLSSFAGPKSYPHGGIEIQSHLLNGVDYEGMRDRLIRLLGEVREPQMAEPLVVWARRREEVYQGPYINKYPDVLFELKEGYGVYWGIHTPLIGTAYEHNLSSGGHRKDSVFLLSSLGGASLLRKDITLMDVAPTILELLGVRGEFGYEGTSIVGVN